MNLFKKKKTKNSGIIEIYGLHTVSAALNNPNRNHQKLPIMRLDTHYSSGIPFSLLRRVYT